MLGPCLCVRWVKVFVFSQTLPLSWQAWTQPLPPLHLNPGYKGPRKGGKNVCNKDKMFFNLSVIIG